MIDVFVMQSLLVKNRKCPCSPLQNARVVRIFYKDSQFKNNYFTLLLYALEYYLVDEHIIQLPISDGPFLGKSAQKKKEVPKLSKFPI